MAIFSNKGSKVPHASYKYLGVEKHTNDFFAEATYSTSNGNQIYIFSDLPAGCTDFYCFATYYAALVNNKGCTSLVSVPITLGSTPSVAFLESTYLCISNEVEQYSSQQGSHSASITDDIVDFKKSFIILDDKWVEVEI